MLSRLVEYSSSRDASGRIRAYMHPFASKNHRWWSPRIEISLDGGRAIPTEPTAFSVVVPKWVLCFEQVPVILQPSHRNP